MTRRARRPSLTATMPWTAAEDAKLREIVDIGLASDCWPLALPYRTFGAICDRRLELGLKPAPLL